jgi:hypothetical protein
MSNIECKYKLETLRISAHAKERYSERIMDKDNKIDVTLFVQQHEQKIKEDIFKMIQYGKLLYSGKSTCEFNKQPVDVYLNGTWVIIVDITKSNVITLYTIDLGLGNDFNNKYIEMLSAKLDAAKDSFETINIGIKTQKETYSSIIKENTEQINEYKTFIKNLEKQNQGYQDVIDSLDADRIIAEKEVRDIIATFIGKKVF